MQKPTAHRQLINLDDAICSIIRYDIESNTLHQLAVAQKWPQSIYPRTLPGRILDLEDQLLKIVTDPKSLKNCPARHDLLFSINNKFYAFCRDQSGFGFAEKHLRCGYYGPKFAKLISPTIKRIFYPTKARLTETVLNNISTVVTCEAMVQVLDQFHPESSLLTLNQFITLILTPYVAAQLISEDMKITLTTALEVKDASNNYGDRYQWDVDDEVIVDMCEADWQAMANYDISMWLEPGDFPGQMRSWLHLKRTA
ncbi:hypothetical protein B0H13DRAFT_1855953 [Mycena leptocephala]|nr:hypothetical protein B0H13DRAFT_1855953 [Mycena leptocephala]